MKLSRMMDDSQPRFPTKTLMVCCLLGFLATAGEPDLLDAAQARVVLTSPVPGFCEVLALPVDGVPLAGGE